MSERPVRAAIMQSSFLPWRGYFDLIDSVDVFYLYDDVSFVFKSWRNRNRIKTKSGVDWVSVPVRHETPRPTIDMAMIAHETQWAEKLTRKIEAAYKAACFYDVYAADFFRLFAQQPETISELNEALIRHVCGLLGITTEIRRTRDLAATLTGEDRVFEVLERAGIGYLINGPTAEAYTTSQRYAAAGIGLAYMVYNYNPYPQLHGEYQPHLSIIDLLFNVGPNARSLIKSRTPPREIVS